MATTEKKILRQYSFPHLGKVVEAETLEEAVALATAKKEEPKEVSKETSK